MVNVKMFAGPKPVSIAGAATVPPPAIVLETYAEKSFEKNAFDVVFCEYVVSVFGGVLCPVNENVHVHAVPLVIVTETPDVTD
jgi:hypothetical protein